MNNQCDKNASDIFSKADFAVSPQNPLIDEKMTIKISNLKPTQEVCVRAQMADYLGIASQWESHAVFTANADGEIDMTRQAPVRGTYAGIDSMGLFWSMNLMKSPKHMKIADSLAAVTLQKETSVLLSAEIDGNTIAQTTIKRLYIAPDITVQDVTANGIIGKYFYHAHSEPRPGVIVVSGSDGGLDSAQSYAALLASHGYSVLALAYFKMQGLPDNLYHIPLEYFEQALYWLREQEHVLSDRIGLIGRSKGGELALLLGATFPHWRAIVAHTPSSVVFEGLKAQRNANQSSWTYRGQPLPFVKYTFGNYLSKLALVCKLAFGQQVRLDQIHRESIQKAKNLEEARITVEKITAPLLLISAEDDVVWPSTLFCHRITDRLKQHKFTYNYKHVNYTMTGHDIKFPYLPTTHLPWNGGKPKNNAWAAENSWDETLEFLKRSLM